MKKSLQVIVLVLAVLAIDQSLKFYVKTNFHYHEEKIMVDDWARLHFLENEGMAFGAKLDDLPLVGQFINPEWAKPMLTGFRIVAVILIIVFIKKLVVRKEKNGLIMSMALILAGAVGNIIDSIFYGKIFSESDPFVRNVAEFMPEGGGYAGLFYGKVVDMFYFPMIDTIWPSWLPLIGGKSFQFFQPVFNVADSAISVGIFLILVFHRGYFLKK